MSATATHPTLPLVATDEELEIRAAVRGICESFGGPEYHRRIVANDESPTELWNALAEKGYLGVNLPGAIRRRRARHARAADGRRGDLGGGLLAAVDRRLARDRRVDPDPPRDRGSAGGVAARHRRWDDQGRVRDHRARRRHELAQPLDRRNPRRRFVSTARHEDLHLRGRGRRRDPRDRPQARGRRHARAAAADAGRHRRPRPREAVHPGRGEGLRQAVDSVLRRRRGARRPGGRGVRDGGAQGRVRRPQPRADHGRLGLQRSRPPGARSSPPTTRTSGSSGRRRSARTRGSRTRSRRPRSSTSSRG